MLKKIILLLIALSLQSFPEDNQYPSGVTPTYINPALITVLKQEKWDVVLSMWFGPAYVSSIPNLICFIDKSTNIKIGLVQNHKILNPPELYNQKHLWVLIFSEKNFNVSESEDSGLSISNSILAYQSQSSQNTIGAITKLLLTVTSGQSISATDNKGSSNDTTIVHNYPMNSWVYDSTNCDTLYSEMPEFKLAYNSKNRVVISSIKDCKIQTNFRSIDFNFGNFERMNMGISFGSGYAYCKSIPASYPLMLFGQIYLIQPTPPVPRISLAITGGTSIDNKVLFTNVIGGIRIGDFYYKSIDLYNLGIVIAGDEILDQNNVRRLGLFIGIDYRL